MLIGTHIIIINITIIVKVKEDSYQVYYTYVQ